jgi:5-methylcytosine-specific restriction endonuclease McrA
MATKKKNYKEIYKKYHADPIDKKRRAMRNTARRRMAKAGLVKKGDGKHVDHIKPLSKGGTNGRKNLRVVSARTNLRKGNRRK